MPNWCEQDLRIIANNKAAQKQLEEFIAMVTDPVGECTLEAEKFIPYPEHFQELDRDLERFSKNEMSDGEKEIYLLKMNGHPKDGFNCGGYEWCCANWGSKWGICNPQKGVTTLRTVTYHFKSAWSPVLPVINKMSKMFPLLKFDLRYYECGCAFQGQYVVQNGDILIDDTKGYHGNRGG